MVKKTIDKKYEISTKISECPLRRGSYIINKVHITPELILYRGLVNRAGEMRQPIESYNLNEVKDYYKLIRLAEEESPYCGKKLYQDITFESNKYVVMYDTDYKIGLTWIADSNIKSCGIQLPNNNSVKYLRASILKGQTTFYQEEWDKEIFIENLKLNNYIIVGKSYYKPYGKIYGYCREQSGLLRFIMKLKSVQGGFIYNSIHDYRQVTPLINKLGLSVIKEVTSCEFNKFT